MSKAITLRFLSCLGILAAWSGASTARAEILGDVNHDRAVTVCDAMLILDHLEGHALLTTNRLALPLADTDTNGVINLADFQRVIDMIVGRVPVPDFDTNLLALDDGDGFSYLEDWHYGTNPFLRDTDGDGVEDEIQERSKGAIVLAHPPVELYRDRVEGSIVLAQPPVEVYRPASEAGAGIVLAQPPVEVYRPGSEGGAGIVLAQPPVEVFRPGPEGGAGVVLAQPPVAVIRTAAEGGSAVVEGQPPVKILRN